MLKYYEQKKAKNAGKECKLFNKHIFKHQFLQSLKGLLIWSLIVAALMALVIAMYPMFRDAYPDMIASMPEWMEEIFGAIGGGFTNIIEYYSVEGGQIYVLVGAIYAAMMGVGFIKNELTEGSYEFLYTQPVKRMSIFRSKFAVMALNLVLFNVIVSFVSFLTILAVEGQIAFNVGNFLLYSLFALVIHLQIGVIVFALAAIMKKNMSMGIGLALAIVTYFVGLISQLAMLAPEIEFLKHLTPFTYLLKGLVTDGISTVHLPTLLIWSVLPIALIITASVNFKKSDIL